MSLCVVSLCSCTRHIQQLTRCVLASVRNEFLAVRNEEGSFFVCQAVQNVYKGSKKIKVRWMTANGRVYTPDFYDTIGE